MASATVDSTVATPTPSPAAAAPAEPPLNVDSLPTVDLRCLSQSELYSLSLCSPSTFDPLRCDDVVIPKIDRSVFNESAGSRKQTYSRLRLAPASDATAAGSPSSLRRRTPHLRHANNLPYHYLDSDPEKAENQQILALLKQLFGLDSSFCINDVDDDDDYVSREELVPIRVDYLDSLPLVANDSPLVPQSGNVVFLGQKRKRGRPRKNENLSLVLVENKVESQMSPCSYNEVSMTNHQIVSTVNNQIVSAVDNEVVVFGNVDERDNRDAEIFNRDGVEVDLMALQVMHDPYEPELMRRTQGMKTEEELLEFLKGLDGQWGSRRRKRRIVDANQFGNFLPSGWFLLLSVKKKDGHVWLFCRRYISPNGQQFESCKEISLYLLSLRGIPDANDLPCALNNKNAESANSLGSENTVGLVAVDQVIDVNPLCQVLSSTVTSASSNLEVELKTGDLPVVQVGEIFRCAKCNLSFSSQNDFFQHQLSSHIRKKPKGVETITDGVIIKDGRFECQFCHKTFSERHRYNGHMGAHVRYQGKGSDESRASTAFDLNPRDTVMITSLGSESNVSEEIIRKDTGPVLNGYKPLSVVKQNGESKESINKFGLIHESMDVNVSKPSLSFKSDAVFENNIPGSANMISRIADWIVDGSGNPGDPNVIKRAADETWAGANKSSDVQGMSSGACPSFPSEVKVSGCEIEARGEAVCGNVLIDTKDIVGSSDIGLDGVHISCTNGELRFEGEKYAANESGSDFDNKHDGLVVSSGIGRRQHFESKDRSFNNVDILDGQFIYPVSGSEQNIGSGYNVLAQSGDRNNRRDTTSGCILPRTTSVAAENDNVCAFLSKDCANTGEVTKDASISLPDKGGIGDSTDHFSLNEQANITYKYKIEVSSCFMDSNKPLKDSESNLAALSAFEVNAIEQYVGGDSARQMEEFKMRDVSSITNDELVFPFSSSNRPAKMDALTSSKHERRLEFRSFFPSENAEDSTTNFQRSVVKESKNQPSGSALLAGSLFPGASHDAYSMGVYATQVEVGKLNDAGNFKTRDFRLASDNRPNGNNFELEGLPAESLDMESGMKQMLSVQSSLGNDTQIGLQNSREVRTFDFDLHDSVFSDRTYDFENNINMIFPGKIWDGTKIDEVGNSGTVGLGGPNSQPVEDVLSGSIWRTGQENLLQTVSSDTSTPPVESTNCFRNFNFISEKGEGLFGVNEKYDSGIGFESLRLGRTDPVEYSFMTAQSSTPLPDVNIGQSFDSSFWLGRDSLMPNATGPNQEPAVCVWCRNEFYQEPIPTGSQTGGAIGSMCPDCSSRVSQQFNVL